jgi:hypothetical protein
MTAVLLNKFTMCHIFHFFTCCKEPAVNNMTTPSGNQSQELRAIHRNKAIWNFWRKLDANNLCPYLRRLAQVTLSVAPSSAAAESCFSLLKAYFDAQQLVGDWRGALEDYIKQMIAIKIWRKTTKRTHSTLRALDFV